MLSLKDKLLKAGVVTAEQVKKVEDDEAAQRQREQERRDRAQAAKGGRDAAHGKRRDGPPEKRKDARGDGKDEKRAARENQVEEAQRWRQRLEQLRGAGKAEQYEVIRGWVVRHRIDDKTAVPTEQATRFHFAKEDGAIGHVTLEPEVQARVAAGEAGIIAFMGFNGMEHAVVPADLARDVHLVKPEWLRALVGITDQEPPAEEPLAASETPPAGEPVAEGSSSET